MPDIVSPLSATMFFPPLERGWRRSFTEIWDVMEWPSCPTTLQVVGGGSRRTSQRSDGLADLTPGTSPDDIDRTLFAAGGIKLDPYELPDEHGYAERGEGRRHDGRRPRQPPVERVPREHAQARSRRARWPSTKSSVRAVRPSC